MDTTYKSVSHIATNGKPGQNALAYITPADLQVAEPTIELSADQEKLLEQVRVLFPKRGPDFVRKVSEDYATGDIQPAEEDRWTVHTAAEAFLPLEPIDWCVSGLLEFGRLTGFVGDGGTGKTYTTFDLGVSLATGEQYWCGFKLPGVPVPVLYIDEETGDRGMRRRLRYVMDAHNALPDTPFYYTTFARTNVLSTDDIAKIREIVTANGVRVLVVDALMDVIPGADENAVKDMQPALMALLRLARDLNILVITLHHSNKMGGYRGSTAIKGAVDNMFLFEKAPDSPQIAIKTEKGRDIAAQRFTLLMHFQYQPGSNTELKQVRLTAGTAQAQPSRFTPTQEKVLTFLDNHPGADTNAIMANTGLGETARQTLNDLEKVGTVEQLSKGSKGRPATWGRKAQEVAQ